MSKWYDLDIMREHHKNKWAQDGEDGLLVHIFSNIEPRCKFGVEFGAGGSHGTQNLKWLKHKLNWDVCMWDFTIKTRRPYIYKEVVTPENINDLFEKYEVPKDLDVVVIDVDGQDYWMWEALEWRPQIIEIEFNTKLDVFDNKVMETDREPGVSRDWKTARYGASLSSLKKLGNKKGYSLIDQCGKNLFFILSDLVNGYEVNINDLKVEVHKSDKNRKFNENIKWVEV